MKLTIALLLAGTVKSQVLLNTLRNLEEADGSNSDGTVSGFGLDLLVDDTINFLQTAGIPIDAAKRKLTYLTNQIKHYKGLEMGIPENASGYDAQVALLKHKIFIFEYELQHQVDSMKNIPPEIVAYHKKAQIEALDKAAVKMNSFNKKITWWTNKLNTATTANEKFKIENIIKNLQKQIAELKGGTTGSQEEFEKIKQQKQRDQAKKERAKNAAQRDVLDTDAAGNVINPIQSTASYIDEDGNVIGPTANTVDIQINEAGCCQYNANNNKCASWNYKYGKCIPLAHKTIGCIRGFWNRNAKLVSGHCVKK